MGNLLFSPNGRIGPNEFMKAALILIIIGIVLTLPELFGAPDALSTVFSLVSLVTIWCWVVIWVKRYHDAGKSGWSCLIPILVFLVLMIIMFFVVAGGPMMEMISAGVEGADEAEIAEMEEALNNKILLPLTVGTAVISAIVAFGFNALIKQDMHDNQYGPYGNSGDTFS